MQDTSEDRKMGTVGKFSFCAFERCKKRIRARRSTLVWNQLIQRPLFTVTVGKIGKCTVLGGLFLFCRKSAPLKNQISYSQPESSRL